MNDTWDGYPPNRVHMSDHWLLTASGKTLQGRWDETAAVWNGGFAPQTITAAGFQYLGPLLSYEEANALRRERDALLSLMGIGWENHETARRERDEAVKENKRLQTALANAEMRGVIKARDMIPYYTEAYYTLDAHVRQNGGHKL